MVTPKSTWSDRILRVVGVIILAFFAKYLIGIGLLLGALFVAIGILALIGFLISSFFSNKKFQEEYKEFLHRADGSCFFFYNSRKSSVEFAKHAVVPHLDPTTRVVFVDGEEIDCGPDSKFISHMLYGVKEKKGFPYLIKVIDEQALDCSVNNLFYNTMTGKKPLIPLLQRINAFYEAPATSK
ncbi:MULTISPECIES: hypothetical protein [Hymenobacter]|uniref:hypothetical protein n=1 Tax=Hymenobacter TaxID=89966 RepID=UPI001058D489|nr:MULTISPECIES: hypothetical protein [Hymenobacter]QIL78272.1 hypothetical protein G7064_20825 [Hymenobacter sp. HDW8]